MGTAKRDRQKANRAKRRLEDAKSAQTERRKRTGLQWGLGLGAAFVGVLLIAWLGGAFGGDDSDDSEEVATTDPATSSVVSTPASSLATDASVSSTPATDSTVADSTADDATGTTAVDGSAVDTSQCPEVDGSSPKVQSFDGPLPMCIDTAKTYEATVETNLGTVQIALDAANKPVTVNNFVTLARWHYYDDTPCHRIIPDFMAQCGDPTGTGTGGPGYAIEDEITGDESYVRGTVAMANSGPNTGGSQFFMVTTEEYVPPSPDYTVFGEVVGDDATLDALDAVGNPANNGTPPLEPVDIISVTITES